MARHEIDSGWERLTCMHGVLEDLDWIECDACQELAKSLGLGPNEPGSSHPYNYMFMRDPEPERIERLRAKYGVNR